MASLDMSEIVKRKIDYINTSYLYYEKIAIVNDNKNDVTSRVSLKSHQLPSSRVINYAPK